MGIKRSKTAAVLFIILFLGYYQRWLYVPIFEAIQGHFSLDPVPALLENINQELQQLNAKEINGQALEETNKRAKEDGNIEIKKRIDPLIEKEAAKLAYSIQKDLELNHRGQNLVLMVRGCRQPKLVCGPPTECGLGCQIHYVVTCLMIAYDTNRTLVMNWEKWPYVETHWIDMFLPIGVIECVITDNDTATVIFTRSSVEISYPEMTTYPYRSGLPIPYEIGKRLKKLPTSHFVWWMGQFCSFAMRLQLSEEVLMKKLKKAMKFHLPTVGLLIRKRDKLSEKKKSITQSIDKYMISARKYFTKLEQLTPDVVRRVFIATDDRNVVKLVRKRYHPPKWEILGFQLKTEAEDLLKDIYLLSECDFVICSFGSDICRLVLELKESRNLNSTDRVKSLDHKYFFSIPGFKKLKYLPQI